MPEESPIQAAVISDESASFGSTRASIVEWGIVLAAACSWGCSPQGFRLTVESVPQVRVESVSLDGARVSGHRATFPFLLHDVEFGSGGVLVAWTVDDMGVGEHIDEEFVYGAYDWPSGRPRWVLATSRLHVGASDDAYMFLGADSLVAVSQILGERLWSSPATDLYFPPGRVALRYERRQPYSTRRQRGLEDELIDAAERSNPNVDSDHAELFEEPNGVLYCRDVRTGDVLWKRGFHMGHTLDWLGLDPLIPKRFYMMSDGLESFDLVDGSGWAIAKQTSSRDGVLAFFRDVSRGMSLDFGTYGGTWFKRPAATTHRMSSPPYGEGDRLYFATRRGLVACDRVTGRIQWITELPPSGSWELRDVGKHLAVLSPGWRYYEDKAKEAPNARMLLVEQASGSVVARFELEVSEPVLEWSATDDEYTLLTPQRALVLDPELTVLREHKRHKSGGEFLHLVRLPLGYCLRTTKGLAILGQDLEVLSWNELVEPKIEVRKVLPPDPYRRNRKPKFDLVSMKKSFDKHTLTVDVGGIAVLRDGSWDDIVWAAYARSICDRPWISLNHVWANAGDGAHCFDRDTGTHLHHLPIEEGSEVQLWTGGTLASHKRHDVVLVTLDEANH